MSTASTCTDCSNSGDELHGDPTVNSEGMRSEMSPLGGQDRHSAIYSLSTTTCHMRIDDESRLVAKENGMDRE